MGGLARKNRNGCAYSKELEWAPGKYARMGDDEFLEAALRALEAGLSLNIKTLARINAIRKRMEVESANTRSTEGGSSAKA